jgi:hypothetical protein
MLQLKGKDRKWTQSIVTQELGLSSLLFFRPSERTNDQLIDYLPAGFKVLQGPAAGKGRGTAFSDAGPAKKRIKQAEEVVEDEPMASTSSEPEVPAPRRAT